MYSREPELARRLGAPAQVYPPASESETMCFSAPGSFALSGILATLGGLSLAKSAGGSLRMFAAIPLIFAAQQATEGLVWLTVDGSHGTLNRIAATVFLGIALIIWPVWTPLSLELAERNARRRSLLRALCWAGVGVAVGASVLLTRRAPSASVLGHSIRYDFAEIGTSPLYGLSVLAYVASTALPWFASTIRWGRALGSALVFSCVVSMLIQKQTLTSVWCFFAAVLSGLILFVLERERRARQGSVSTDVRGEAKAAGHS